MSLNPYTVDSFLLSLYEAQLLKYLITNESLNLAHYQLNLQLPI